MRRDNEYLLIMGDAAIRKDAGAERSTSRTSPTNNDGESDDMTELTIERLFRDFAKSIGETANRLLEPYHAPGTIQIPEEELQFWCGHIKAALGHSKDELSSNNPSPKDKP